MEKIPNSNEKQQDNISEDSETWTYSPEEEKLLARFQQGHQESPLGEIFDFQYDFSDFKRFCNYLKGLEDDSTANSGPTNLTGEANRTSEANVLSPEQSAFNEVVLSKIEDDMVSGKYRQGLNYEETIALSFNTDLDQLMEHKSVGDAMIYTMVDMVREAGEDPNAPTLPAMADALAERPVVSDLLKIYTEQSGNEIDGAGIKNIGDYIMTRSLRNGKSDNAVATEMIRIESVGYKPFESRDGVSAILTRGADFQEILDSKRPLTTSEVDALYKVLPLNIRQHKQAEISSLFLPNLDDERNQFWYQNGTLVQDVLSRSPLEVCEKSINDNGELTAEFGKTFAELYEKDNPEQNKFIEAYDQEFFSDDEAKRALFGHIFEITEKREPDATEMPIDFCKTAVQKFVSMVSSGLEDQQRNADWFASFISRRINDPNSKLQLMTQDAIENCPSVLYRLRTTGVEELARSYDEIAEHILINSPEQATEMVKKLEEIYLRKDIPKFAKLYFSAHILFEDTIGNDAEISPVLKDPEILDAQGEISRRDILMTDLLKNSIRSNNRSLRDYLRYCTLSAGKENDGDYLHEENSTENGDYLEEFTDNVKFRRKFFRYARLIGFENAGEILRAMDEIRDTKNAQHTESVSYNPQTKKYYYNRKFEAGDLIKGVHSNYLHLIMKDGYNCPEMTGIGAKQDYTHWDTDFGTAKIETLGSGVDNMINSSMADTFGDGLYAVIHREGFSAVDTTGEHSENYKNLMDYEVFHKHPGSDFRGIRTGIGSEDIDLYVVDHDKREKALRLGYEMAKNGIYAPIIDRATEEVIFTPKDYQKLRARMSGMRTISETLPVKYEPAEDLTLPDSLISKSGLKYSDLTGSKYHERLRGGWRLNSMVKEAICACIDSDQNLPDEIKDRFHNSSLYDGNSPDETGLIVTGSTARGTGLPGDLDVDIVMRLSHPLYDGYKDAILKTLTTPEPNAQATIYGKPTYRGIRKGMMELSDSDTGESIDVEVDISPVVATNQRTLFSDQATKERLLSTSFSTTGDVRDEISANIVMAKALLKDAGVYKKGALGGGGLGGLGVENWILQSGGSLVQACKEFLTAADNGVGGHVSFDEFKSRYAVFDLGENHFGNNYESPYNNFVSDNMTSNGYTKMCQVCADVLQQITV